MPEIKDTIDLKSDLKKDLEGLHAARRAIIDRIYDLSLHLTKSSKESLLRELRQIEKTLGIEGASYNREDFFGEGFEA